jgi:hypothetical protein
VKHHIKKYCEDYKDYLTSKNQSSLSAFFVDRLEAIAMSFMLTDWEIIRLLNLMDKVHILKGSFHEAQPACSVLQGVYDATDIRQVFDTTFTTIEQLAAVVKIKSCSDVEKHDKTLLAIFGGNENVAKLKSFSEHPGLKLSHKDA